MTDQLAYIQQQLNDNGYFNGRGQAYGICGDLVIPDGGFLYNIETVQLDQGPTRRSIKKQSGSGCRLERVKVHRGEDTSLGTITDSAGIWISGQTGQVVMHDVEVYGNGPGTGMRLIGLNAPVLDNLRARDMRWSRATDPGTEQIVGIWMDGCNDFTMNAPSAKRLDASINGVVRPWQTDGIDFSGCRNFTVLGAQASFCGEGIDVSGSAGNTLFSFIGGNLSDIDSFGLKLANSASNGSVVGVIASNCGLSGFVVSGPVSPKLSRCERIKFIGCQAFETGNNLRWSANNVAAFSVLQGPYDLDYPMNIEFDNCTAVDRQNQKTMKFGFRNENNSTTNKLRNCQSVGHAIAATLGTFG